MRPPWSRWKTQVRADPTAVPSVVTSPPPPAKTAAAGHGARPNRPAPSTDGANARSRKETLVSAIPALLAAQMSDQAHVRDDAAPVAADLEQDATSQVDPADDDERLASDPVHGDYLVEVEPAAKTPRS